MNRRTLIPAALLGLLLMFAAAAWAEEKNGVQLTVSRKTLDRNDTRSTFYYYDRIDRTQGLKITVKNVSFKPMPEGEVEWTLLVRKYASTTVEKYSGTEKLEALKPANSADLVLGAAQISGWRDVSERYKDKLEYQVIVKHGGAETVRTESTPSFDALKKRAIKAAS